MGDLTPEDVAADLRLDSVETVLRYLRGGVLPGYKVGRRWRIEPAELAAFKQRQRPEDPNRIEPRSARGDANLTRGRVAS